MCEYVHYGCGQTAPEGWANYDSSPTLRLERMPVVGQILCKARPRVFPKNVKYGDAVRGLPVKPNSCQGVYCCHVLEHLSLNDFDRALRNTLKILRAGGVFRLVLPDIMQLATWYINNPSPDAAIRFMHSTHLGQVERPVGTRALSVAVWGASSHRWMWDEKSVIMKLAEVGFHQIRKAECGDCEDRKFLELESPDRFQTSVALQCSKP